MRRRTSTVPACLRPRGSCSRRLAVPAYETATRGSIACTLCGCTTRESGERHRPGERAGRRIDGHRPRPRRRHRGSVRVGCSARRILPRPRADECGAWTAGGWGGQGQRSGVRAPERRSRGRRTAGGVEDGVDSTVRPSGRARRSFAPGLRRSGAADRVGGARLRLRAVGSRRPVDPSAPRGGGAGRGHQPAGGHSPGPSPLLLVRGRRSPLQPGDDRSSGRIRPPLRRDCLGGGLRRRVRPATGVPAPGTARSRPADPTGPALGRSGRPPDRPRSAARSGQPPPVPPSWLDSWTAPCGRS
jgi:hypothetical protein